MNEYRYSFCNVTLASDTVFPALEPRPDDEPALRFASLEASADPVDVRWDPPEPDVRGDEDAEAFFRLGRIASGYVLEFPGMALFTVSADGARIRGRTLDGAPAHTFRHLLLDHVLPRVLSLRGELVLHASGARVAGRAVAFLGTTGSGKSTLAVAFARAGHPLLSDDALRLCQVGDDVLVSPAYPSVRLWPANARELLAGEEAGARVAHYTDKERYPAAALGGLSSQRDVRLERLYALEVAEDAAAPPRIHPLRRAAALAQLVRHVFRLDTVDAERVGAEFHRLAASPVLSRFRRLVYPHRYDALPAVLEAVRADLEQLAPG